MSTQTNAFRAQVKNDAFVIAEFLELLHWLREQEVEVTLDQVISLYREGVIVGRFWNEVLDDLGLPENPDWNS